jgi:hypothetical protein
MQLKTEDAVAVRQYLISRANALKSGSATAGSPDARQGAGHAAN